MAVQHGIQRGVDALFERPVEQGISLAAVVMHRGEVVAELRVQHTARALGELCDRLDSLCAGDRERVHASIEVPQEPQRLAALAFLAPQDGQLTIFDRGSAIGRKA